MNKVVTFLISGFICACTAATMTSSSETTYTTMKGISVVLKPDSTWDYKNSAGQPFTEDLIEELGDGRIINIRMDQSWGFMEKSVRTQMIMAGVTEVSVSATATNKDISQANATVSKEILDKMVAKVNATVYKGKKSGAKILECVKQVEKVAESSEKFIESTRLWQVNASAKIGREQIILIAECMAEIEKVEKIKADSLKAVKKNTVKGKE